MGSRRRHLQSRAFRGRYQFSARPVHLDAQLADVLANPRAGFHDGLVQFRLHLLGNVRRSLRDEIADVRA